MGPTQKKVIVAVVALAVAIALTSYYLIQGPGRSTVTQSPVKQAITISGAGASFPAPQILEWAREFTKKTGIVVTYSSIGSGAGRAMLFNRTVVFACSDPPLDKKLYSEHQGKILQVPWILGAVVITYNVPEIPRDVSLNFTGMILALIFKGEISKWNDARIKEVNPRVAHLLPDKEIVVVHRSDSSGTTRVLTGYLNKAAPDVWGKDLVGFTIDWPIDRIGRGLGGKGNEGVAKLINTTSYSIGYVEASYALTAGMPMAKIMNRDGYFVLPTEESVMSAVENVVDKIPDSPLGDFSDVMDAMLDASGPKTYPIVTFSYVFVYSSYEDGDVAKALSDFIYYALTEGQNKLIPGYYRLPSKVVDIGLKAVNILRGGS